MSTLTTDRLYKLLPYIHQLRDAEQGEPLRALLQVIEEQVGIVEADIRQIYDNWFIETCEDWVVPYIGDLIGYTTVHEAGEPGAITTAQGQLKNAILVPRREIANTIAYRRRKGSLALLEQLANDVAGWPARAVEFYTLLGWNQHLAHRNPKRGALVDLRHGKALHDIDGPFDRSAHTIDVRRIAAQQSPGRYNIPNVGLFLWRLRTYSVTKTPVLSLEQRNCYTFSVLGNNTPLFTHWNSETEPTQIAGRSNVPQPISRHDFAVAGDDNRQHASADYYGEHKSLAIWAPDWPVKGAPQPIPIGQIVPADLSIWDHYRPVKDTVAVDPVLGRIVFPPRQVPKNGVRVSYYYGLSAPIGGGEYWRALTVPIGAVVYEVGADKPLKTISQALIKWNTDVDAQITSEDETNVDTGQKTFRNSIIEITDSGLYEEPLTINLPEQHHLQIRAANGSRPVIRLADRPDQFVVRGKTGSYLTLDGLLIAGRSLQIEGDEGDIAGVIIRHSTLVPGWSLKPDCEPDQLEEPSIDLNNAHPCLTIEHSILGSIQINNEEVSRDPLQIRISDSVLDATGSDCDGPACEAIGAYGPTIAHAYLTILRSTVFGRIDVHSIELAENTIFMGLVKVVRRQRGCMRFCYVRPHSRTPKRYHCQPDLAQQTAEANVIQAAQENVPPFTATQDDIDAAKKIAQEKVRPQFNSRRYGTPTYCQLATSCATEIKRGADDESEIGVYHNLFQPQREANLRARLEEYIPARADVGIILAN